MGSYSVVRIGDLTFHSVKNDFDPAVMLLFTETDKRVHSYSPGEEQDQAHEELYKLFGEEPLTVVEYVTALTVVKDRLEFMGFTLPFVRRAFREGVEKRLAELAQRRDDPNWRKHDVLRKSLAREERVLRSLTFDTWLENFAYIVRSKLKRDIGYLLDEGNSTDQLSLTLRYMLGGLHPFFGFPTYDFRVFMRAAVEITGTDAELEYDLTEIVAGEYFHADEDFCSYARRALVEDFAVDHKTVVLTEGKSDKWVLAGSLRLLYPHLADYYSFMNFKGVRAPGGASVLVATLKAFIGAGIVNRIVAFFDNDTAAQSAMRSLNAINIPENVRVLRYPDISIARSYPTLGPQGMATMDVNGLAGSIELYFGRDILVNKNGYLTPVQWRGYDVALHQYQGEVMNKGELQASFLDKLQSCQANRDLIGTYDWGDIQVILDAMRTAFHE